MFLSNVNIKNNLKCFYPLIILLNPDISCQGFLFKYSEANLNIKTITLSYVQLIVENKNRSI